MRGGGGWTRVSLLALATAAVLACADGVTDPAASPTVEPDERRVLGLVEVTLTGIGTGAMRSSAITGSTVSALEARRGGASAGAGGLAPAGLTPPAGGDGTIQLEPLSTGSFTSGARGSGGERWLFARYRVRNAQTDGTVYGTALENVMFLAVDTDGTIGETPITALARFDGSAAATELAAAFVPSGLAYQDPQGLIRSAGADVVQVFAESEVAPESITRPSGVLDVFPYGFVVQSVTSDADRTLPASPGPAEFDGVVTFAFRVPLESSAAEDPFRVSAIFMAVEDGDVRVTQSLVERDAAGAEAFLDRAGALGATGTLLPGGSAPGLTTRRICSVRTAGTAASTSGTMFDPVRSLVSLDPDPYAAGAMAIASDAAFTATFDGATGAVDGNTFVVRGLASGRVAPGVAPTGSGTTTLTSPAGSFLPGEEVEVTLAGGPGLGCVPMVARLRAEAAAAPATYDDVAANATAAAPGESHFSAAADLNGDGLLDVVGSARSEASVFVYLSEGGGAYADPVGIPLASGAPWPLGIDVADLEGDGDVDVVVADYDAQHISLLFNDGTGATLVERSTPVLDGFPLFVTTGDMDGDGDVDLWVATENPETLVVLINDGVGGFRVASSTPYTGTAGAIALGDVDGDGTLDGLLTTTGNIDVHYDIGGSTTVESMVAGTAPWGVMVADLDDDGHADLTVRYSNAHEVWLADGVGGFDAPVEYAYSRDSQLADVDGDGDLDLVAGSGTTGNVLLNDGAGAFTHHDSWTRPFASHEAVFVGDADGDGDLDLLSLQTALSVAINEILP